MSGRIDRPEFRFGRTVVTVAIGDLLGQEAEGVVFAANCRGVMGSLATPGLTGLRSLGGSEIEREAMVRAPLDLGSAILTSATGLEERGARAVIHAVIHPALGERTRAEHVRRVVPAIFMSASRAQLRSLALPLLGVESLASRSDIEPMVEAMVLELVGVLRRSVPRLDRVTIVCRFEDHVEVATQALTNARARVWTRNP
ncbi:MAG: macro domain-containing protein [Thermomicrobiales bacterium]